MTLYRITCEYIIYLDCDIFLKKARNVGWNVDFYFIWMIKPWCSNMLFGFSVPFVAFAMSSQCWLFFSIVRVLFTTKLLQAVRRSTKNITLKFWKDCVMPWEENYRLSRQAATFGCCKNWKWRSKESGSTTSRRFRIMRRASWRPFQNLRSRTALRCGSTFEGVWFNQIGTTWVGYRFSKIEFLQNTFSRKSSNFRAY